MAPPGEQPQAGEGDEQGNDLQAVPAAGGEPGGGAEGVEVGAHVGHAVVSGTTWRVPRRVESMKAPVPMAIVERKFRENAEPVLGAARTIGIEREVAGLGDGRGLERLLELVSAPGGVASPVAA